MAKKKTSHPKAQARQFKYAAPIGQAGTPASLTPAKAAPGAGVERDFSYVGRDLRQILLSGGLLLLVELILWYAFDHTGLGAAVYRLIKI